MAAGAKALGEGWPWGFLETQQVPEYGEVVYLVRWKATGRGG